MTLPLALLGPRQRAALLHVLQDPNRAFQDLLLGLPPGDATPESQGDAFSARSLALSHWLNSSYPAVASGLFLSAELFSAAGNLPEAAVTRGLLGLFYSEPSPLFAVCSLDACLPYLASDHWLATYGPAVRRLSRARTGEIDLGPEDADEIVIEGDRLLALYVLWCQLRTAITLDRTRTAGLDLLVQLFLERGLHNEAALAASDLATYFVAGPGSIHPLYALLPDFEQIPLVHRPLTAALHDLVAAQERQTPFEQAVLPLYSNVSSIWRFPVHLIHEAALER